MSYEDENIWLTQKMMTTLYDVYVRTVNGHIKKIYLNSELEKDSTIRNFRIVQPEDSRQCTCDIKHYNLRMIIAVGFNVNNERTDDREILQDARKIIAEMTKTKAEMKFKIRTGCKTEIQLSFWLFGRNFIIKILTVCNSRRLGVR